MRIAVIENGLVVNVIIADKPEGSNQVPIDGLGAGPGWSYDGGNFTPPAEPVIDRPRWSDADLDPRYFWIDVGPFFDRFGQSAIGITGSTDPQVQGLVTLLLPRKYVDLKRADLPSMLDLLVSKGLITSVEKAAVLNPQTSDYERHIKGLEQPL